MSILKPHSMIYADLGIQDGGPVHAYLTATCAKKMDKYTPFDTGTLAETVIQNGQPTGNVETDRITYQVPYAQVVYYGVRNGKELNYHTDMHKDAGPYWDKRMWSAEGKDVVRKVQRFVNRGGKQ